MNLLARATGPLLICSIPFCCNAGDSSNCFAVEVEDHVLQQFAVFGPLSHDREYFGYIYRVDGDIRSAVTRGAPCRWTRQCEVSTRVAAQQIPAGAKVLGEWHTHAHISGSSQLSPADVHGANDNRHIRCYRAFYSTADGSILAWEVTERVVAAAMSSAKRLGNYRAPRAAVAFVALH
jgi:hypothetical protein